MVDEVVDVDVVVFKTSHNWQPPKNSASPSPTNKNTKLSLTHWYLGCPKVTDTTILLPKQSVTPKAELEL